MKTLKTVALCALAAASVACTTTKSKDDVKVDVDYPSAALCDSVSYYIGFNFGYFIKQNGFEYDDIDMSILRKGMMDYINAKDMDDSTAFQYKPEDMNRTFQKYMVMMNEYNAERNRILGENWLAQNREKSGVAVTESGLQYKIINEGSEVKPGAEDTVKAIYEGTYIDGTEFDSSKGNAIEFSLKSVIKGWQEGLQLIGEGGEIELYVPSELGYGEMNYGPIKANSVLIFKVKLEKVIPAVQEEAAETEAE